MIAYLIFHFYILGNILSFKMSGYHLLDFYLLGKFLSAETNSVYKFAFLNDISFVVPLYQEEIIETNWLIVKYFNYDPDFD